MGIDKVCRWVMLSFLLASFSLAHAQRPRVQNDPNYDKETLHFGFTVGLNFMDFGIDMDNDAYAKDLLYADITQMFPGFHVSMVSNLRLAEYLDLRALPGICFGQRNLTYYDKEGAEERIMKVPSTFIEIPLLLKYKAARLNNFRPYLIGGFNIRYDLASNKEFDEEDEIYVRINPFDVYYELGFGIDNYLQYFKYSTELKISVGLRDILNHTPHDPHSQYANAISRMNSFLVMLSFHFE